MTAIAYRKWGLFSGSFFLAGGFSLLERMLCAEANKAFFFAGEKTFCVLWSFVSFLFKKDCWLFLFSNFKF